MQGLWGGASVGWGLLGPVWSLLSAGACGASRVSQEVLSVLGVHAHAWAVEHGLGGPTGSVNL